MHVAKRKEKKEQQEEDAAIQEARSQGRREVVIVEVEGRS